jgi:hypothetical protein
LYQVKFETAFMIFEDFLDLTNTTTCKHFLNNQILY